MNERLKAIALNKYKQDNMKYVSRFLPDILPPLFPCFIIILLE